MLLFESPKSLHTLKNICRSALTKTTTIKSLDKNLAP